MGSTNTCPCSVRPSTSLTRLSGCMDVTITSCCLRPRSGPDTCSELATSSEAQGLVVEEPLSVSGSFYSCLRVDLRRSGVKVFPLLHQRHGELHGQGCLQAVYIVIASLSNFRALTGRASRLDAAQR